MYSKLILYVYYSPQLYLVHRLFAQNTQNTYWDQGELRIFLSVTVSMLHWQSWRLTEDVRPWKILKYLLSSPFKEMVFCQVLLEVNSWKHQNCFWTWSFSSTFRDRQLGEMNIWLCPKWVNSKPALCDYDHLSTVYGYSEEIIYGKFFF